MARFGTKKKGFSDEKRTKRTKRILCVYTRGKHFSVCTQDRSMLNEFPPPP